MIWDPINCNAVFYIFRSNQEILLYPHIKAFINSQNLWKYTSHKKFLIYAPKRKYSSPVASSVHSKYDCQGKVVDRTTFYVSIWSWYAHLFQCKMYKWQCRSLITASPRIGNAISQHFTPKPFYSYIPKIETFEQGRVIKNNDRWVIKTMP